MVSRKYGSKGISPLIAAVLLIAFTMAIAGIIATWATQFVQQQQTGITGEAQCIGALDVDIPQFSGGNITLVISNLNDKINLTQIKLSLFYEDSTKNTNHENVILSEGSLAPGDTKTFLYESNETTKPKKVRIITVNCPKYPVEMNFP